MIDNQIMDLTKKDAWMNIIIFNVTPMIAIILTSIWIINGNSNVVNLTKEEYEMLVTNVTLIGSSALTFAWISYRGRKFIFKSFQKFLLHLKKYLIIISVATMFLILTDFLYSFIYDALGVEVLIQNQEEIESLITSFPFFSFFMVVIFAPITEEIVFRASLTFLLNKHFRPIFSIIIGALVFGVIHIGYSELVFLPLYSTIGIVAGIGYIKSNFNVIVPITIHLINNLIAYLIILV